MFLVHPATRTLASLLLLAVAASGCGGAGGGGGAADLAMAPRERDLVVTKLIFGRQKPAGVSPGFDVDGYTAKDGDPKTCGHASLVSPTGTPGIDNQLFGLVEALDLQYSNAVDSIIQEGVNNGMLLVGVRLLDLDDAKDDPAVRLELRRLTGHPTLGNDKILDPNQTFALYKGAPTDATPAALKAGTITTGVFELHLPVALLTADFTMHIRDARLTVQLQPDGSATALLGGRVGVQNMLDGLLPLELDPGLKARLPDLLAGLADQNKDPATMKCLDLSTSIELSLKPAFIDL